MKRTAALIISIIAVLNVLPASASADQFETVLGLRRAVVVINGGDMESYARALEMAKKAGGRGIVGLVPTMLFGRFPAETGAFDFEGLDVEFITDVRDIDPSRLDVVTLKSARGLLEQEKILALPARPVAGLPRNDKVFEKPVDEVLKSAAKVSGPRRGSPAMFTDRPMDQNTEFLIGNVLINLILPESSGGSQSENWTEDEIGLVIRDVQLGLSQYENSALWTDLAFSVNCPAFHRAVPVSIEPIEGDWNYDPIWITEAVKYIGQVNDVDIDPEAWALGATHTYNNAMRNRFLSSIGQPIHDWVFSAFVCDASVNGCWQGPSGGYAAYTIFLGGPYIVVPYPACGFGDGINFAHVFIHEMSHVFWALDEYASAEALCSDRSGYLNYVNGNSYFNGCGVGLDCIMNNYLLTEPLPICRFTMGQVGLADEYQTDGTNGDNGIPDIYDVKPVLELDTPEGDTTYANILVTIDISQEPVPNENFRIEEYRRIDYAPAITKIEYDPDGDGFYETIPVTWEGATDIRLGMIMTEELEPGENKIRFRVENAVGLKAMETLSVYFVSLRFYSPSAMADEGMIEIRWSTAEEIFGADFEIWRQDLTGSGEMDLLTVVDGDAYHSMDSGRRRFIYYDEDVVSGHRYRYKIKGDITWYIDEEPRVLSFESNDLSETAIIPLAGNFISPIVPNPTDGRGSTFSFNVPRSYHDVTGNDSRDIMRAPAIEVKTDVKVEIFDVAGRPVRRVYELSVFGGQVLTVSWDGLDDKGKSVASGIYFMKVRAGNVEQVEKIVVIR